MSYSPPLPICCLHKPSLSVKSTSSPSDPKPLPGGGSYSDVLLCCSRKSSGHVASSSLYCNSLFPSIATYRGNVFTNGRAANLCSGVGKALYASCTAEGKEPAGSNILTAEQRNRDESSLPSIGKIVAMKAQQGLKLEGDRDRSKKSMEGVVGAGVQRENENEEGRGESLLPTMEDIVAAAAEEGVKLEVKSIGPSFQIIVSSIDGVKLFGKATGWVTFWTKGKILHLEAVKLERGLAKQVGNIFGAGFFVGASTLRYGLDQGCKTAELLAIFDDEATHAKLVKYYNRLGFKTLYKVNEEDWRYLPDRLVWGGVGTRMNADCEQLLRKWSKVLKPKGKL